MSRFAPFQPEAHGAAVSGLSIIPALPAHAPAIAAIEVAREGGDPGAIEPLIAGELEQIRQGRRQRYTCLGVVDGAVVAFARCGYRALLGLPEGWYLIGINVLVAWRRQGIGAALTAHRLAWLSGRADAVYYNTSPQNRASVALHEAFGFELVAEGVRVPGHGAVQVGQRLYRAVLSR